MTKLPRSFDHLPDHRHIAENILRLLHKDQRVLGVYLSGSFVAGKPDRYSDLDLYLLVRKEHRERIKQDHSTLRAKVGDLISDFPATYMGDPNQIIACIRAPTLSTWTINIERQRNWFQRSRTVAPWFSGIVPASSVRGRKSVPRLVKHMHQLLTPLSISKIDSGPGAFTPTQKYGEANSGKLET
jgi:Nucleotidyltransferase domain